MTSRTNTKLKNPYLIIGVKSKTLPDFLPENKAVLQLQGRGAAVKDVFKWYGDVIVVKATGEEGRFFTDYLPSDTCILQTYLTLQ